MSKDAPLSSAEVASTLGVSTSTVNRLVAAKELTPMMKLPGRTGAYLFEPQEVHRALQKRTA